jgi:hypothetical protein
MLIRRHIRLRVQPAAEAPDGHRGESLAMRVGSRLACLKTTRSRTGDAVAD